MTRQFGPNNMIALRQFFWHFSTYVHTPFIATPSGLVTPELLA